MAKSSKPVMDFKRGDDFKLTLVVSNKKLPTALAQLEVIKALEAIDPPNPTEIAAQMAIYNTMIIVDISTWTMTSQIRYCGKLMDNLQVNITNGPNGVFTLTSPADNTGGWVPRKYDCDIEFDDQVSGITSSETFTINVKEDVTHG